MTVEPTEEIGIVKARMVLNAMRAGALKPPYAFDQGEAETIWGAALMHYDLPVLTRTCGIWIEHHDDFPTVAEFKTIADSYADEARRVAVYEDQQRHGHEADTCIECDDNRYVTIRKAMTVVDPSTGESHEAEDRYVIPCSRCFPERHELYMRGHFDEEHVDRGGCPKCWSYLPSLRERHKADLSWRH